MLGSTPAFCSSFFFTFVITHSVPCEWDENGKPTLYTFEDGPNHTYECDYDGMRKTFL